MIDLTPASTEQLRAISRLTRKGAIRRWLIREKIPFINGADGWPQVMASVLASRMGGLAVEQHLSAVPEPKVRLRHGPHAP